jgi:polyvinyl alcohol dehydrogenase (cytochrome)
MVEGWMNTTFSSVKTVCSLAACTSLIAVSIALGGDASSDWTMGGQNLGNWRNQGETPISAQNVGNLKLKWIFAPNNGGDIPTTPAVANGIVYFPDLAGNFYAVNAVTGAQVWQARVSEWSKDASFQDGSDFARNAPAVYNGMVILGNQAGNHAFYVGTPGNYGYIGGGGARVMAVDAGTGALKWMTQVESFPTAMVTSSPVVYNGIVYVGIASAEENTATYKVGVPPGVPPGGLIPCCFSRGSVVALDANTGAIKWQQYMVPNKPGYSGGGVWDTPVIDPKRNRLYVGTGNNYSVPFDVETCFAKSNGTKSDCTDPTDYFDSLVALDVANNGAVVWSYRGWLYDAWNVNCILTVDFTTKPVSEIFGQGANCPVPTGPDYDFGGSGPNLLSVGKQDILGIGQKSGVYWAFNPDAPQKPLWSTQVGPGSSLGGIEWGTATDGKRIYVPISNLGALSYLPPSTLTTNGGSWAALDPVSGNILWQRSTPNGFMALGPASVANGVVYVGSMDPTLNAPTMFALDAKTGNTLWSYPAGSSVNAAPAIVGGSVYWGSGYGHLPGFGTSNNKLFAFSISN